jgi:hypothetical protein
MKYRNKLASCGSLILALISSALPVSADEANPTPGYTYKDDWAVVSAPPPPGPYRAVNIDPRVPGAGAIPPLPLDAPGMVEKDIPAEALATPPAAGMPTSSPQLESPAASQQPPQQADAQQRPLPPRGYSYPAQPRYPAQTRQAPSGSSYSGGYRNQPPYGYYGAPGYPQQGQQTQQVPPPPVYDAMIRNQQPHGYPSRQGTP